MDFARRYHMTPAQAARLAARGQRRHRDTEIAHRERVKENVAALDVRLSEEQLAELDRLFPPPKGPAPLEML